MALRESFWTHGTGVKARCFSLLAFYHGNETNGHPSFSAEENICSAEQNKVKGVSL